MAPSSTPPLPAFLVVSLLMSYLWFSGAVNEEGAALLLFKESIKEDPEECVRNWNSSDGSPCSWNGVSCQDMRVVSISIPNRKLVGTLSPSLGSLSSLRHINLRNNQLQGSLPMELFKAQGLQSLVLYSNNFSGSLPSNIGSLGYLQILNLAQNSMNGPVPPSLLQFSRLRTLDLSFNKFSGRLPDGFGAHLKQLEKLDLSHNGFSGQVPSDLGNLTSIEGTLDLSHNNFSGRIPASLGNLPEKVYIDLADNNLDGPIPQNGALVNRGPTAFLGNPLLCGPPLKNPCQADNNPSPQPYFPGSGSYSPPVSGSVEVGRSSKRKGLSTAAVIAIVIADILVICLIALAFLCCYWRLVTRRSKVDGEVYGKEVKEKRDCLCFRKDGSENLSDNVEQVDLVQLDSQVGFDLDELLKASAFVLGKSGIGIVYKVVLEDGLTLAVRRLGEGGLQRFKEFQTEVEAIGKVKHPNIVALRAYYWSVDEKLLIYDYIPNGNLNTALHGRSGTLTSSPMSWLTRLSIMKGVAKGMAYLHEYSPKKYVHGDLTPSNILLGRIMEPYIADFGLGRLATIAGGSPMVQSDRVPGDSQQQSSEVSVSFPGSCYQAPEALKLLKPSQKWDIYSYGVILLEMISGRLPVILMGNSEMNIVKWVELKIEEHKPLSDVLDPTLAQEPDYEEDIVAVLRIALACVQTNPERRPSMRHISDAIDKLDSN